MLLFRADVLHDGIASVLRVDGEYLLREHVMPEGRCVLQRHVLLEGAELREWAVHVVEGVTPHRCPLFPTEESAERTHRVPFFDPEKSQTSVGRF